MKLFKRFFLIVIIICTTAALNGCAYANNKGWEDMTAQEKQEVQQAFKEIKDDLGKDYSDDGMTDKYATYIINKVEQAIDSVD